MVLASVALVACDPGWGYAVASGNGIRDLSRRYVFPGPSATSIVTYAWVFAGHLRAQLEIKNTGADRLQIDPARFHVLDSAGAVMPVLPQTGPVRCKGRQEEALVFLNQNERCAMDLWIPIHNSTFGRNAKYRQITLVHDGVARGASAVPIRIVQDWTY